jgi:hypothetical protein
MDDWLIVARTESEARIATQIVMSVFAKLGFRVNLEKSVIEPTQVIEWLGHIIDSRNCSVSVSKRLMNSILEAVSIPSASASLPLTTAASILGKLSACALVQPLVLSYVRPWQQYMQQRRTNGHSHVTLNVECLRRAAQVALRPRYWDRNLLESCTLYSDASATGLGYVFDDGQHGNWRWSSHARTWHINWLEFIAAVIAIEMAVARGYRDIRLHCDNIATLSWIRKMRTPDDGMNLWFRQWLFRWLDRHIVVTPIYIPSHLNPADVYSRL